MENKEKITAISDLGKIKFIEHITKKFSKKNTETILAIGDDAALIKNEKATVLSTDLFMEGIHFNLHYFPLKHLGFKVVSASIADIFAMNAMPKQILVSLGLSAKFSVEAIEEIYFGIHEACKHYSLDLIGGDVKPSLTGLCINVTSVGETDQNESVSRNGADVNDLICVTGNLGASFLGLKILDRENTIFMQNPTVQPKLEGYDYVLRKYLNPPLNQEVLAELKKKNVKITSMIDVSEGLASDLMQICKHSGTGCKVFLDKLPIDEETHKTAQELNLDAFTCALNGGEDYEFLFTVKPADYEKLIDIQGLSIIGHITNDKSTLLITPDGSEIELKAQAWK